MRLTAAPASSSGVVALGVLVITSATGMSRKASVRSISRVRSPAVTTPARPPSPSTTATVPRFSASSTTHSRIGRSGARVGRSRVSITSATRRSSFRPSAPLGWSAAKSSRRNPLTSSSVTARASPRASATVVLAVGARVSGQASSTTDASSATVAWRPRGESASPVRAMIGTPRRLSWLTSPNSSSEAPLFESTTATSSRPTMPRSPWSESTGCRKVAGVPVEVNVAAILRAISPDLPTPETMTRPLAAASRSTARAKVGPSPSAIRRTAAASRASTRLPRSTSAVCSGFDIATFLEVPLDHVVPLAPRLEDPLCYLAHRRLASGGRGHDPDGGLHLRDGVRDGDRQRHATKDRQIGDIVAHEGALVPRDAAAREEGGEGWQLPFVLHDLVHLELACPQLGGLRPSRAHQHHCESRVAQQLDGQPIVDVEALELDGVIADLAEVDAAVGEDAVHV